MHCRGFQWQSTVRNRSDCWWISMWTWGVDPVPTQLLFMGLCSERWVSIIQSVSVLGIFCWDGCCCSISLSLLQYLCLLVDTSLAWLTGGRLDSDGGDGCPTGQVLQENLREQRPHPRGRPQHCGFLCKFCTLLWITRLRWCQTEPLNHRIVCQ